uniref:C-type lectin domain-containing protein n=1 Tax=Sphaeramia orbicularis TaxID=375764 RepID=A0A672Y846_9TELE
MSNISYEYDDESLVEMCFCLQIFLVVSCQLFCTMEIFGFGWRMSFCSCYFFSSTAGPWEAGRNDCKNRDADLVVIDSTEEQFIQGFKDYYWIGLTDRVNEGTWKWVDGSPVTLTFWDKGEPNNGMGSNGVNLGEEDCAEKPVKGKWNDLSCNTLRRWICEK